MDSLKGSVSQQADNAFSNRWSVGNEDSPKNDPLGDVCPWSAFTDTDTTSSVLVKDFTFLASRDSFPTYTFSGSSFPEWESWKKIFHVFREGHESSAIHLPGHSETCAAAEWPEDEYIAYLSEDWKELKTSLLFFYCLLLLMV